MEPPDTRNGITYTLYADTKCPKSGPKLIDASLATVALSDGGLRWHVLRNRWLFGPFFWQQGALRLAWKRNLDVLVVTGSYYCLTNWLLAPFARLFGKRVLWWTIGQIAGEPNRLQRWLKLRFLRLANAVLFYGHRDRADAVAAGMDPDRLYVVYNSLPLPEDLDPPPPTETDALRTELFVDASLPVLLYSGRLRDGRRIDMLLQAAKALIEDGLPVNVLLVGDGPARTGLQDLTRELGLDGAVHMEGACYDAERLARLFHASDLCVAPGGIGLLCIQALAHGVPCITHDDPYGLEKGGFGGQGPEHEAIIPGRTGMLYHRGDIAELVHRIGQWLTAGPPKEQVRRQCRRMVDLYYNPANQARTIDAAVLGVPATSILDVEDFAHVLQPSADGGP